MADFRSIAKQMARKHGLDPRIFVRQIGAESGFNPNAVSPAGAIGIAQIMPATARGWKVDPRDPVASLDAAARNMAAYVRKYGSYRNALVAYNAGPGAVGKPLYAETSRYIAKILQGSDPKSPTLSSGGTRTTTTKTIPGVDNSDLRRSLIADFVSQGGPDNDNALISLAAGLQNAKDTPSRKITRTSQQGAGPTAAPAGAGVANFEGHQVAAWIKPVLMYARQQGWKGQVNSGYRSYAEQKRIYDSGVRPAAKPGTSNHEGTQFPRGAIDVSDAQTLSRIISRSKYRHLLQWAGAKDPVHFSHPHNGSY